MAGFFDIGTVRRAGRRGALALLALGLAGCAALAPLPREFEVSEARLGTALARQFPVQRRYLDLFDVALHDPQLQLLPERQRLGTRMAYTLGGPLMGPRTFEGTLALSYGLRFEPADGSVRLSEVRVESFEVPDVPAPLRSGASRLGGVLAESLLRDAVLYRFKPEELQRARAHGLQPGAVRVVPGGVQLTLEPVPRP